MTIHETDTRVADADRLLDDFERKGAHVDAVIPLLPALLADEHTASKAEAWLTRHALVGMGDLSAEAQGERSALAVAAQREAQRLGASSTSIPGFAERFNTSDETTNKAMDERLPQPGYPGARENYERLNGEQPEQNPLTLRDTAPRRDSEFSKRNRKGQRTLDFANGADEDETPYGTGVSRPFFMED